MHRDGDWHPALHIWVGGVDADGLPFVLFQRRSMTKDTWPGALDVAIGGHLRAGETIDETVREAEEEIGLRLAPADLAHVGRRFSDSRHSGVVDREMQEIFACRSDLALTAYRLHSDEVDAIVSLGIADARRLFAGELKQAAAIECPRGGEPERRVVGLADFVWVEGSYILDALQALERVVAGQPVTPFELRVAPGGEQRTP
ncbi:MAG TPA: NUDIX domain-containing protein [Egibacteraceae bacterium]|nr:NUDIX domain-containing protein [Egibacteraceae bacterium]